MCMTESHYSHIFLWFSFCYVHYIMTLFTWSSQKCGAKISDFFSRVICKNKVPKIWRKAEVIAIPQFISIHIRKRRNYAVLRYLSVKCQCPLPSIWQRLKLWWLSGGWGNIIRNVLYCQCATSSMGTVYKNSLYSLIGPCIYFFVGFLGCIMFLCFFYCFVLPWSVESFPFMFWHWRATNLSEPP